MSNPFLSKTRHKLNEAAHFLAQMMITQNQPEIFLYNQSAFLTALRSVLDIMEHEFVTKNGFASWFCQEKMTLWGKGFNEINQLRNADVHNDGNLALKLTTGISGTIVMHSGMVGVGIVSPATPTLTYTPIAGQQFTWDWNFQGKNEHVITTCENFFKMLENMVADCELKFWP